MLMNQVLYSSVFPDKVRISKVISIFMKDDPSLFENYRPISLFPTISELLETFIFIQLFSYFNKKNVYMIISMVLELSILQNSLHLS